MGASDVTVTNFTAIGTLADGLHFNANRRVTVDGLVAQNTGDDGLAFVTYYDPSQPWTYGPGDGPFNQAGVGGEWNNGGSVASHITVTGGRASGVRVQGGYDIAIDDVTVTGKDYGIQLNSAIAAGPRRLDQSRLARHSLFERHDRRYPDRNRVGHQQHRRHPELHVVGLRWLVDHRRRHPRFEELVARRRDPPRGDDEQVRRHHAAQHRRRNLAASMPTGGGNGGILLASLRDSVVDGLRLVADHPVTSSSPARVRSAERSTSPTCRLRI